MASYLYFSNKYIGTGMLNKFCKKVCAILNQYVLTNFYLFLSFLTWFASHDLLMLRLQEHAVDVDLYYYVTTAFSRSYDIVKCLITNLHVVHIRSHRIYS